MEIDFSNAGEKLLTIDVEDWFHVLEVEEVSDSKKWDQFESRLEVGVERILSALEESDSSATFFILGWVAQRYPRVVKKISDAGHDIGTHSHEHRLVYEQTINEFKYDLRRSIDLIEKVTCMPCSKYRAPGFSITKDCLWAFDEIVEAGISVDASIFAAPRAHGGLNTLPHNQIFGLSTTHGNRLICFPMSHLSFFGREFTFGGGGYHRLFPQPLLRIFYDRPTNYSMSYFHPRDFDVDQPRLQNLNPKKYIKTYLGLRNSFKKFQWLLKNYKFENIEQRLRKTNTDNLKEIQLTTHDRSTL